MSKLNDQRVAITKRIMETKDPRQLEVIASYLDGRAHLEFTPEEIKSFEEILAKHRAGEGRSSSWPEVRRRLKKEFGIRS